MSIYAESLLCQHVMKYIFDSKSIFLFVAFLQYIVSVSGVAPYVCACLYAPCEYNVADWRLPHNGKHTVCQDRIAIVDASKS